VKQVRQHSPIKSHWILVPLLLSEIAEKPNMSNAEMKHVVLAYVKEKFITSSLLQNARTMAKDDIFGDPATNDFFANGLVEKMKEYGINVKVLMKDRQQVLHKLVKANNQSEIEQLKHKHAPFMNEKALKYLNAVDDAEIPQCS
jgi:hypothetical protein